MGTASVQGALWGARALDWAEAQEPAWQPVYAALLSRLVRDGARLLDIGCGAGGALLAARRLGADVSGLDAAPALVAIARQRLPGARIAVGEMEALPFLDGTFDVVTSFNAFQFAGDVVQALREGRRVLKPGGRMGMLVWSRKDDCDLLRATLPSVFALLPPAEPAAPPVPFAERGVIESLMRQADLTPDAHGVIECTFVYANAQAAWRALAASAPLVRAVHHAGEDAVRKAVLATFAPFRSADGSIAQTNRFRWVSALRV